MSKNVTHNDKTVVMSSPSLRAKIGAAAVSGALAIAMVPAVAVAAPFEGGNGPAGGEAQAAQTLPQAPGQEFGGQMLGQEFGGQMQGAPADAGLNGMGMDGTAPFGEQGGPTPFDGTAEAAEGAAPKAPAELPEASEEGAEGSSWAAQAPSQTAPGFPQNPTATNSDGAQPQGAEQGSAANDSGAEDGQTPAGPQNAPANSGRNFAPSPRTEASGADAGFAQMGPGAGAAEIDAQIIDAIDDEKVKAAALAGNLDAENKRPAIPEGEINVAQLIDTIRNTVFGDRFAPLDAGEEPVLKAGLAPVTASGTAQSQPVCETLPGAKSAQTPAPAAENESARPATRNAQPSSDQGAPDASTVSVDKTGAASSSSGAARASAEKALAAEPSGNDTSSLPLFQQILEKVVEFFKNLAK